MAIPSSNLKIGDEFTISMWTYRKSEKKGGLLYKEGLFNLNTSYWGIFKNDKWHIIEYDLPVNKWSNIIAIKKKNEIQLYINGKLAGRKEIISEKNKNSNSELYIGAIPAWGKKWQYNGKIDEVIIYGKALAKENFPKSPPPFPSPQKTNVQKINQIKNVKNAQENLQEKILPKAEILNCKGAPCLFINGIPQSGMLYCTFPGMFRTFQYSVQL
jgi:hypothetical protein